MTRNGDTAVASAASSATRVPSGRRSATKGRRTTSTPGSAGGSRSHAGCSSGSGVEQQIEQRRGVLGCGELLRGTRAVTARSRRGRSSRRQARCETRSRRRADRQRGRSTPAPVRGRSRCRRSVAAAAVMTRPHRAAARSASGCGRTGPGAVVNRVGPAGCTARWRVAGSRRQVYVTAWISDAARPSGRASSAPRRERDVIGGPVEPGRDAGRFASARPSPTGCHRPGSIAISTPPGRSSRAAS